MSNTNPRITISHELMQEVRELLEDSVEYLVREECNAGNLISGETMWKIVECCAVAKQAEMQGLCKPD